MMPCPSTRRRIRQGGHDLQQWLKGPALLKTRFAETVQEGWGIGNGNGTEPCPLDVQSSDCEGYHTCYPSDGAGARPDFPPRRSHTAPIPELAHDTERGELPRRSATTKVPSHTEFGMMGSEAGRMDVTGRATP